MSKGNHVGITREDNFITCNNCQISKPRCEFHKREASPSGVASWCKICRNEYNKRPDVRRQRRESSHDWLNRPENKHRARIYKDNESSKEKNVIARRLRNNRYVRRKCIEDPIFKLTLSLRGRLSAAIKNNSKAGSAVRDLGCSIEEFKLRLETLWEKGMSWSNYGNRKDQWNIDHIVALSLFNLEDRQHFLLANHYLNLRPLWASENSSKGNRIPIELLEAA